MLTRRSLAARGTAGALLLLVVGCGTQGSDPPPLPEVRFQVVPRGGAATFQVVSLETAGLNHPSIVGRDFFATGPFSIVLENASPPYTATVARTGTVDFDVTLSVSSMTGGTDVTITESTSPDTPEVTVSSGQTASLGNISPEVRFDVCSPSQGASTCFTASDSGFFTSFFTGTLGDAFTTHVFNGGTPAIYFLDAAQDNVSAVFTSNPSGTFLRVELYVDGQQRTTSSGTQNVLVNQDI